MLVGGINYLGMASLLSYVREEVSICKAKYLLEYDPEFMLHFDILCAKYGIDESKQTEGILSE